MSSDYPPNDNNAFAPLIPGDATFSDGVYTNDIEIDGTLYLGTSATLGSLLVTGGATFVNPSSITGSCADFYLSNSSTTTAVAAGSPVLFNLAGPSHGVIVASTGGSYLLPNIGTYEVAFQASVVTGAGAGQLVVALNNVPYTTTQVGRATGSCQIVGNSLITTNVPNTFLSVINPTATPLEIDNGTASGQAGSPLTAHLFIRQLY